MNSRLLLLFTVSILPAQEIAGRWTSIARKQTIEIQETARGFTGLLLTKAIPLRVNRTGNRIGLAGGQFKWDLELKDGKLYGRDAAGLVTFDKVPLPQQIPQATLDQWMKELSNWGRWGKDDQIGAVNLITSEVRKRAAALVQDGVSVSLSRNADPVRAVDNSRPFEHKMISPGIDPDPIFATDTYTMSFHGASLTHLDAMSHMSVNGKLYNGYPQAEVTATGAHKLAVDAYKTGFFSRGVLIDVPRLKGVPYLEPGTPIYPSDLDEWEKKTGITIRSGDIVFVRTGRWTRRAETGPWDTDKASAGLHISCAKWFKQRDIAVLGSDVHAELMPSPVSGVDYPIHQLILIAMGVPMFDNCDLEPLSAAAAARNRWEFLLTAAPLAVPLGTGSPLNPIATF